MRKVALVFIVAVFVPSLVLAWLGVRSLRDQQYVLERQQSLLYQGSADALARQAGNVLADRQREFAQQVETLLADDRKTKDIPHSFDDRLRANWPFAEVGFVVNLKGDILCPTPPSCAPAAAVFYAENSKFLGNRESAEVFWNAANSLKVVDNNTPNQAPPPQEAQQPATNVEESSSKIATQSAYNNARKDNKDIFPTKAQMMRSVMPQNQGVVSPGQNDFANYSKVASSEAEFRQLVGDSTEGTVARFLEDKLHVLLWYRSPSDPSMVFGVQASLPRLKDALKQVVQDLDPGLTNEAVAVLLDDMARPVSVSRTGFQAPWKHPFVATEIGEALPHWEMAVYLVDPAKLMRSAHTLRLTLGLLIAVLLLAIAVGSWLIVADLNRHLTLARQKTDFVSNVSHELKTPLTSIRMFSELLAEGRVTEPDRQRSYLNIITAEAARLTRLINNVLDFSRLERGEKKYNMQPCDLAALVRETIETYRPHLESIGFTLSCEWLGSAAAITAGATTQAQPLPDGVNIPVKGDRDALAQIIVNLLSNAEKYSGERKEIVVQVACQTEPLPHVDVRVLDRGMGVPGGCEEKIFEQFYRAHDSLSSGIQGSGLGLTLARQIARAHGGEVLYRARAGGGSCFILRLPVVGETGTTAKPI
jgi:signal transduction histidine kinase